MLLSAVSVLVVAQSSSEIPEGLMNNPVEFWTNKCFKHKNIKGCYRIQLWVKVGNRRFCKGACNFVSQLKPEVN